MTEDIWDPINKAAALVTLMTGAPAFLVFIGLPTVAAVVLGLFSISSLLFALIRSRFLQHRAARLLELHAADNKLLQSFNSTISGSNREGETQVSDIKGLISEALQTLRLYVEADVGSKAKVAIKLFSTGDEVLVHTFASTGSDNFSQHRFSLKQERSSSGSNRATKKVLMFNARPKR